MVADVGRTNGLMSLLGALAGGAVVSHLEITLTDILLDFFADSAQRQFAEVYRVGTHIRNQTLLIEALCKSHRLLDRKAELAGSLLLEGAGGEGRSGHTLERLNDNVAHLEISLLALLNKVTSSFMIWQMAVEFCGELLTLATGKLSSDTIIGLTLEGLDFLLTLGYQANGHTLHATS